MNINFSFNRITIFYTFCCISNVYSIWNSYKTQCDWHFSIIFLKITLSNKVSSVHTPHHQLCIHTEMWNQKSTICRRVFNMTLRWMNRKKSPTTITNKLRRVEGKKWLSNNKYDTKLTLKIPTEWGKQKVLNKFTGSNLQISTFTLNLVCAFNNI